MIGRAGVPCVAYPDGVAARISESASYEPGAMASCGPRPPLEPTAIDDNVIVVEVLTPSAAAADHGRKLSDYFSLASVQRYLILDSERRVAIHHKRGPSEAIETRVVGDGPFAASRLASLERSPISSPRPENGRRAGEPSLAARSLSAKAEQSFIYLALTANKLANVVTGRRFATIRAKIERFVN